MADRQPCHTCAAFNDLRNPTERGECRRRAPSLDSDGPDWPLVNRYSWCAEHLQSGGRGND